MQRLSGGRAAIPQFPAGKAPTFAPQGFPLLRLQSGEHSALRHKPCARQSRNFAPPDFSGFADYAVYSLIPQPMARSDSGGWLGGPFPATKRPPSRNIVGPCLNIESAVGVLGFHTGKFTQKKVQTTLPSPVSRPLRQPQASRSHPGNGVLPWYFLETAFGRPLVRDGDPFCAGQAAGAIFADGLGARHPDKRAIREGLHPSFGLFLSVFLTRYYSRQEPYLPPQALARPARRRAVFTVTS